jgi:hypothetical protein
MKRAGVGKGDGEHQVLSGDADAAQHADQRAEQAAGG